MNINSSPYGNFWWNVLTIVIFNYVASYLISGSLVVDAIYCLSLYKDCRITLLDNTVNYSLYICIVTFIIFMFVLILIRSRSSLNVDAKNICFLIAGQNFLPIVMLINEISSSSTDQVDLIRISRPMAIVVTSFLFLMLSLSVSKKYWGGEELTGFSSVFDRKLSPGSYIIAADRNGNALAWSDGTLSRAAVAELGVLAYLGDRNRYYAYLDGLGSPYGGVGRDYTGSNQSATACSIAPPGLARAMGCWCAAPAMMASSSCATRSTSPNGTPPPSRTWRRSCMCSTPTMTASSAPFFDGYRCQGRFKQKGLARGDERGLRAVRRSARP